MFNVITKTINWGGKKLTLETGRIARQANGAVLVRYEGTTVLCTAVAQKEAKPDVDFFPLTVVYQEKYFASGRIPGGFFKREGKPTEKETLVSRLIDRPIRPLFDEHFRNETQIICTVLEYDGKNDSDIPAIIGASAALAISEIPFVSTIAGVRIGLVNGEFVLNPEIGIKNSKLELVVAGTKNSIMMVESEASEITEEQMLGALEFAHKEMQIVIDAINEMAKEVGKTKWEVKKPDLSAVTKIIKQNAESDLISAFATIEKQARSNKINEAYAKAKSAYEATLKEGEAFSKLHFDYVFKTLEKDIVRGGLVNSGKRIDGRTPVDIRNIVSEVGVLPRTHGSALFTRGETQALVVATLGTGDDEQMIDGLDGLYNSNFMLHYNFPPYSVGEVGRMSGAGRREIGHGKLAWRAVKALIPSKSEFPYTIRIVSEITESNGSSSMATVCGTSLALMDAGVPLARPIAGIAMGLVMQGEKYVVLSDIMGDEDHLGDMDFKVAGTSSGVTSLQMDIKIQGITIEIMKQALAQAKTGRMHILGKMAEALSTARTQVNSYAPQFTTIKINPNKIREVIGSGGKVIKEIVATSGAKIDIDDSGEIKVAATTGEAAQKAIDMIMEIVAEPVVGEVYDCKVMKIMDFGAIVQFMGKQQGLIHISELAPHRVDKVEDILRLGDEVRAQLLNVDRQGKIRLSIKSLITPTHEETNLQANG
ncbi:MAG: polyribonucleotide nucleotidyltransferase [Rickettsiales bacterium]|nr:polyribonucleotide nucleotidyltransferase [Rickettsiales bacterium]